MNFSALLDIYERRNIATGVPHPFCFHVTFDTFLVRASIYIYYLQRQQVRGRGSTCD